VYGFVPYPMWLDCNRHWNSLF